MPGTAAPLHRDPLPASREAPVVPPQVRRLGLAEFGQTYDAMRRFTATRDEATPDEIWLVEHPPVFTQGLAGREAHLPRSGSIPVERIDRGGQITYHAPGQAVVYLLLDLARMNLKVRQLVHLAEQSVIDVLAGYGIMAARKSGAPGVYVDGAKIAALGFRVRRGCSYHGLALNVDLDLAPFSTIDPCGYPGQAVTRTRDLGATATTHELGERLAARMIELL